MNSLAKIGKIMAPLGVPAAAFLLATGAGAAAVPPPGFPGFWWEAESAGGDVAKRSMQYCSGHFGVDWQARGGTLAFDLVNAAPLHNAILLVRYGRDDAQKQAGELQAWLAPAGAKSPDGDGVRQLCRLELPNIGHLDNYRWARALIADIPAGRHTLLLATPAGRTGGLLDLVGIVPGETRGLWQPPNNAPMGAFVDQPAVKPAWELGTVAAAAFGNLAGGAAPRVIFQCPVRNNLIAEPVRLRLNASFADGKGGSLPLPTVEFTVAPDQSQVLEYPVQIPAGDRHPSLTLTLAGEGVERTASENLTVVPVPPLWQTLEGKDGKPLTLSTAPDATTHFDVTLASGVPDALLYLRHEIGRHQAEPSGLEVAVGPVTAAVPGDAGVRQLGTMRLRPASGQACEGWGVIALGQLAPGTWRIFLKRPHAEPPPLQPGERRRFGLTTFTMAGVIAGSDRGLWVPPTRRQGNGATNTPAFVRPSPVEVETVTAKRAGQLFLGDEVLGDKASPIQFEATLSNHIQTAPASCLVRPRLVSDGGDVRRLPEQALTLPPGAQATVAIPVLPPDYGWYGLVVDVVCEEADASRQTGFGVLRAPHRGTRPESIFGLAVGDREEDRFTAEMLGVKWRRGVPGLNPGDVLKKSGDQRALQPADTLTWWTDSEIAAVRQRIEQWQTAGVCCLGYVNYNLPWNCDTGWPFHKSKPKDLAIHVEMVRRMIAPLRDLVQPWEVWNEPWVGGWTWGTGTAQDYRDMTRAIWDACKPQMPEVKIIGGGSTPYQRDVLFPLNTANSGYVDGVSTHPYGKPDTSFAAVAALEAAMLTRFSRGGGSGGIWATELGTAPYMFAPLPPAEADFMVARTFAPLYLESWLGAGGTPIHLFFFTSQYGAGTFSGGEHNLWDNEGGKPAPRPGLVAFSAMAHFLEDSKPVADLFASSKAAWAILFDRPDCRTVAVILEQGITEGNPDSLEAQTRRGILSLPVGDYRVYDYLGREMALPSPVAGRRRIPLSTWEARYFQTALPVDRVKEIFANARLEEVPSLLINPRSFTAPLPAHPPLRVKVENLGLQDTDVELTVQPPPEIVLVQSRQTLRGMKPGEVRYAEFPIADATPNAANRYAFTCRAVAQGIEQVTAQVVQVACARQLTPIVDGDLADWAGAIPVTMVSRGGKDWREITMDPSRAKALLAARQPGETVIYQVWTAWDENAFHVAARIPDETPSQALPYSGALSTIKELPYMADCLQIAIDCLKNNPDDLLAGQPLYEKAMASDVDYEFCAARLADGSSQVHRLKSPGTNYQTYYPTTGATKPPLGVMPAGAPANGGSAAAIRYDAAKREYVYEISIPWAAIPELGERIRRLAAGETAVTHLAVAVNDREGRNRTFWTQEAGDLQAGAYGFSPNWGGGMRKGGGRIITDWGFQR